jgi:hypothetical protein
MAIGYSILGILTLVALGFLFVLTFLPPKNDRK